MIWMVFNKKGCIHFYLGSDVQTKKYKPRVLARFFLQLNTDVSLRLINLGIEYFIKQQRNKIELMNNAIYLIITLYL